MSFDDFFDAVGYKEIEVIFETLVFSTCSKDDLKFTPGINIINDTKMEFPELFDLSVERKTFYKKYIIKASKPIKTFKTFKISSYKGICLYSTHPTSIYAAPDCSLQELLRSYKNHATCLVLVMEDTTLHVATIETKRSDNGKYSCFFENVDHAMSIVKYVSDKVDIKRLHIIDQAHVNNGGESVRLLTARLLQNKLPSIYQKYGFKSEDQKDEILLLLRGYTWKHLKNDVDNCIDLCDNDDLFQECYAVHIDDKFKETKSDMNKLVWKQMIENLNGSLNEICVNCEEFDKWQINELCALMDVIHSCKIDAFMTYQNTQFFGKDVSIFRIAHDTCMYLYSELFASKNEFSLINKT